MFDFIDLGFRLHIFRILHGFTPNRVLLFSFFLLNAYGLVVNKGFIASARLYPTMQYTLALP